MRKYETTYILDPNLTEEVVQGVVDRLSEVVTTQGGEVGDVKNMGRRRMTIEIKGRYEGIYVTMKFDCSQAAVAEVRRQLTLTEEVLRGLIISLN